MSNNKILYIHVGMGKTGTTFLQNFLFENKLNNLYYPKCNNDYQQHLHLSSIHKPHFQFEKWKDLHSELENEYNKNKTTNFLLSSEEFFYDRLFIENFGYIKFLFDNYSIKIVITLDNVFNNVYKSYLEFIKKYENKYVSNNIYDFIKNHTKSFDYKYQIEKFEKLVNKNNIILIKYSKNNYLYKFLNTLDLISENNKEIIKNHNKICNKSVSFLYSDFLEYLFEKKIPKGKYVTVVKNLKKLSKETLKDIEVFKKTIGIQEINEEIYENSKKKLEFLNDETLLFYKEQNKINDLIKYCDEHNPVFRINFNYIVERYGIDLHEFYKNFYTHLFSKFYLNIRNPKEPVQYSIIQNEDLNNNNKLFCHIHCYNIDQFNFMFSKYISNLQKYFNIIITYSIGTLLPKLDKYVLLKVKNRGRDIGAKMCSIKYIYDNEIDYSHILFLHSKTNNKKRIEYFNPLIKNEETIKNNINLLKQYDFLFNNITNRSVIEKFESEYISNRYYHKEFLNFLKVSNTNELDYSEGNCFYASSKVIDFIFKKNLTIIYNCLNEQDDFDLAWVKCRYNRHNISSDVLYSNFLNNAPYMNLNKNNKAVGNDFGNKSNDMPDGMFEHIFERIYINVLEHLKLKYKVLC